MELASIIRKVFTDTSPQYLKPYQPSLMDTVSVKLRLPKELPHPELIARYEVLYLVDELTEELREKLEGRSYEIRPYPKGRNSYQAIRFTESLKLQPVRLKESSRYVYLFYHLPPLLRVVPPPLGVRRSDEVIVESAQITYYFVGEFNGKRFTVDGRVIAYPVMPQLALDDEVYPFRVIPGFRTPEWVKGALLYQIFPDRFYNGDPSNDVRDGEYTYDGFPVVSRAWGELPDVRPYPQGNRTREFFGGDLKGVLDKLGYLHQLGVRGIYLNPIFLSPSNHKYDTQDYEHVDPHLGVIIEDGDYKSRISERNLRASDELLTKLALEMRKRGMRLILDGVFNHCGSEHRWFKEAKDNPNSPHRRFFKWSHDGSYECWWNVPTLPKLNYEESPELEEYIIHIGKLWVMRGASGWRLDVATDLGHSPEFNRYFWRRFRDGVKELYPDVYVVAEAYGRMHEWFAHRAWDSVMNYQGFFEPVSWFFTGMERHSFERRDDLKGDERWFIERMAIESSFLPWPALTTAMNQLSNHDHSRFLTRTTGIVDHDDGTRPQDRAYDGADPELMKLAVAFQMIWPGAPTIYYGDEVALGGFTDPDNRRTFPWDEMDLPMRADMLRFHEEMVRLRRELPIKNGSVAFVSADKGALGVLRFSDEEAGLLMLNTSEESRELSFNLSWLEWDGEVSVLFITEGTVIDREGGVIRAKLPPKGMALLRIVKL